MDDDDPLIGELVAGRYKVLAKMGEGGMGTVYLAEHVAIEKRLALKVLLPGYARKADLKERFLREARAAAAIGHENIVDITDFGETPDKSVFFAMEFLDGHDLSYHLKEAGAIDWPRAKRILLQICRALGAAHAKRIVHRDMKPENIFLVDREGRPDFVKVLDFGIAKVTGSAAEGEHRLTRTGMIFGTPEYMSPEQAQGHSPDHRVDIYAVGVIMYEVLTGVVPFKADTFMGILTKHIFENPVPPTHLASAPSIPADVEQIVLKAMSKDREDRFQSMTEMAAAISQSTGRVSRSTADVMAFPSRISDSLPPVEGRKSVTAAPSKERSLPDTGSPPEAIVLRGRTRAVTILAVAIGFITAAAAALVITRDRSPGPTGSAAASAVSAGPSKTVQVKLVSEPRGAKVLKGTTVLGQTPALVDLPRSGKSLMLTFTRPGYREHREPMVPDRAGIVVAVKLDPLTIAVPVSAPDARPKMETKSRNARRRRRAARRQAQRAQTTGQRETPPPPREDRQQRGGSPTQVQDLMNPFK